MYTVSVFVTLDASEDETPDVGVRSHDAIAHGYADVAVQFNVRHDFEADMPFVADSVGGFGTLTKQVGDLLVLYAKNARSCEWRASVFQKFIFGIPFNNFFLRAFWFCRVAWCRFVC